MRFQSSALFPQSLEQKPNLININIVVYDFYHRRAKFP